MITTIILLPAIWLAMAVLYLIFDPSKAPLEVEMWALNREQRKQIQKQTGADITKPQIVSEAGKDHKTAIVGYDPTVKGHKYGRNETCPCMSGKKVKNCCANLLDR